MRLTQGFDRMPRPGPRSVGWSSSIERGSSNATTVANLVERFHRCAERLRHVTIECRPAVDCIRAYALLGAVVYVDPPYLTATRTSLSSHRADFAVEYCTERDHRELAVALRATPATGFLSGYPSALYDELYGDWDRVQRAVGVSAASGRGRSPQAVEVVWSDRPITRQLRLDDVAPPGDGRDAARLADG